MYLIWILTVCWLQVANLHLKEKEKIYKLIILFYIMNAKIISITTYQQKYHILMIQNPKQGHHPLTKSHPIWISAKLFPLFKLQAAWAPIS